MRAEDAIQSLRENLTKGATGCLSSQKTGAYRIYMMQGDILAAHGPDDGIWIVRRLVNNGAITESQGRQVIFYLGQGYRLEELLLDQVPDQLFLDLLNERFRQNILDFSFLRGPMRFEEMEAIFVDNIQVGHDSLTLLDDVLQLRERISPLRRRLDAVRVRPTGGRPRTRQEARILDLCTAEVRLDELVVLSPYEEGPTLDIVRNMIEGRSLLPIDPQDPSLPPAPPAPTPAPAPVPAPAPSVVAPAPPPEDAPPVVSPPETVEPAASPEAADEEEEGEDMSLFGVSSGSDDELDVFADYDSYRGAGQGQFSVDRELLDRVDLSEILDAPRTTGAAPAPAAEPTGASIVELGDAEDLDESELANAMSLSFGPPPLELMEQRRKIAVCNEVMSELSRALDGTHGSGSGRAFIQLLLDGTPHQYAVLFMGVETDAGGRIDADHVIRNLRRRPEAERRRMLNLGILNLIERALSSGMEELDEATMDVMLKRIAGYQMRLGL